jgi:DivIVA domain-containing protein
MTTPSRNHTPPPTSFLTAEQVRGVVLERAPFGRRGLDDDQVQAHLDRVAEAVSLQQQELHRLTEENRQLKYALREWHRQIVGYDAAALVERTQAQIEDQIGQAEAYSRDREQQAARRYEEILGEARQRARAEAERAPAVHVERAEAPEPDVIDGASFGRRQASLRALVLSLDALSAQVDAIRQAFTFEAAELGGLPLPPGPPALRPWDRADGPATDPVAPDDTADAPAPT